MNDNERCERCTWLNLTILVLMAMRSAIERRAKTLVGGGLGVVVVPQFGGCGGAVPHAQSLHFYNQAWSTCMFASG